MQTNQVGSTDVTRYHPDAQSGLSLQQVHERRSAGLINIQPQSITKTIPQIIRDNTCTFFNAIMLSIALCLLLVGSYKNILFLGVMLANLVIGTVQEIRAKRTLEQLSILSTPKACVVRESRQEQVATSDLVLDDVICLSLGDQIPVDAIVLSDTVEVNEALLTGEPDAIRKVAGDTLLSGSFVVSGSCRARVEHIGTDNYATKIAQQARQYKKNTSVLMKSIKQIIKYTGICVLPLGAFMFCHVYFGLNHPLKNAVEQSAGAMVGMIPAGLLLLTSVSLAVGAITLARRKTLVQELYCIETLSRVDTLCLDKTGTLTTGCMEVVDAVALDETYDDLDRLEALFCDYVRAMENNNPTAAALCERFTGACAHTPVATLGFSSTRKYSAVAFEELGTLYLGAPEMLVPDLCTDLREQLDVHARDGKRVVLLAHCAAVQTVAEMETRSEPLEPIAYLLICDQLRPEAADTLRYFREEGVQIKLISGDNPQTVAHIANRLQVPESEKWIDVSQLDDESLKAAATQYTIFGRVSPKQKRLLIQALKSAGHTVAMTGDGVNDVLALKDADCSVAMAAGSDAARQVSQLVLLDSNFASMPQVVLEGRRVINNITRTASLFLVKTTYSFLLTLLTLIFGLSYPFQPLQLSLISSLTVGLPAFVLALEPNKRRISGNFLVNVLQNAIPGALCIVLYVLCVNWFAPLLQLGAQEINTLCVYLAGTAGLTVLLRVCLPFTWKRAVLWGTMTVAFLLSAYFFDTILSIGHLHGQMWYLFLPMLAACYPLLLGFQAVIKMLFRPKQQSL